MGNICRSPSGEAVMNKMIKKEGLEDLIKCDSAGTIAYHEGEPPDARMRRHALRRGYKLSGAARRFRERDFDNFDYIIAMDNENYSDLMRMDFMSKHRNKIYLMTEFSSSGEHKDVPDPYYSGPEGFELVLDIIEDSCKGLLEKIKSDLKIKQ
jgi:protein-tyrosine phosphatase